jgi:hypothetical protein
MTTDSLAGREIVFTDQRDSRVSHRFDTTTVEWSYQPGDNDPHPVISGRDPYEAFDVAEGLVYAQFHHRADVPNTAVSLVLDVENNRSLAVVSAIQTPPQAAPGCSTPSCRVASRGWTRVAQSRHPRRCSSVEECGGTTATNAATSTITFARIGTRGAVQAQTPAVQTPMSARPIRCGLASTSSPGERR